MQPFCSERSLTPYFRGGVLRDHGVSGEFRMQDAAVRVGVHGQSVQELPVLLHALVERRVGVGDQLSHRVCGGGDKRERLRKAPQVPRRDSKSSQQVSSRRHPHAPAARACTETAELAAPGFWKCTTKVSSLVRVDVLLPTLQERLFASFQRAPGGRAGYETWLLGASAESPRGSKGD